MVGDKKKAYSAKAVVGSFENRKEPETQESIDKMCFTARNDYAFKKLFGRVENIGCIIFGVGNGIRSLLTPLFFSKKRKT